MQNKYSALICDLDGTLVDSEPIHADAWLHILAQRGLHFTHEWFEQWIGTSDRFLAKNTIEQHNLEATVKELQLAKQLHYHQLVSEKLETFVGVEEGLQRIGQQRPIAIATNSGRKDAQEVFKATKLDEMVQVSVTADDVDQLKPAPDMYLLAAQKIGVNPQACVAIEDSPAGVASARAAGMYVLGLTTSQVVEKMGEAHEIFADTKTALARAEALLSSS